MNKKLPVSIALTITIIAMTVTFSITMIVSMNIFDNTVSSVVKKQAMYDKISEIDTYVRGNYFGEVDETLLGDRIGRGYMEGVDDKYSTYYSEKEYTEMQRMETGKLAGIGVEVVRDSVSGLFTIARVFEESPAAKAGVEEGGHITQVAGVDTATLGSVRALNSLLRGEPGATLDLTCLYGTSDTRAFEVQWAGYRAPTVEKQMVDGYAYIRIYSFTADTAADFDYLVQQAQEEGAAGLVFDLRGNNGGVAGGVYESAYQMIDLLCPRGTVARSESKSGVSRVLATSGDSFVDLPMVTLVNQDTAAAAELFAVSVRDLAGGKVVGVRTQGRGTLQSTPFRLSDGSAVSITNARLLTGKGESYNEVGISPDIEAFAQNESSTALLKPDPAADTQIQRALEAVRSMAKERGLAPAASQGQSQAGEGPEFAPQPEASDPDDSGSGAQAPDSDVSAVPESDASGANSQQEASSVPDSSSVSRSGA